MKITVQTIRELKGERPVVALTAYDTIIATLASNAEVDLILVGDSVGTTYFGFETTLPVTLDMMVHHTACVARANPQSLLVADVPFPEGHLGTESVLRACARLFQEGGAEAVKIEGGQSIAAKIQALTDAGMPVLGHIGLLPQSFYALGGYRKLGIKEEERQALLKDAAALQDAGVFAIVGEMIEEELSGEIAQNLEVPFIGIGCGPQCDGQILVTPDLLGMTLEKVPGFVKKFANLQETIVSAFGTYVEEVRNRKYPS